MTINIAKNPIKIEEKDPNVHLIPFEILVPSLSLFISKWTSIVFIYTTGTEEIDCESSQSIAWASLKDTHLNTFCKDHLFHIYPRVTGNDEALANSNHIDDS